MSLQSKFEPTPAMITAAEALFLAQAIEQTIRPVVESYQRKILNEGQWHIGAEHVQQGDSDEIILDPKLSYLLGSIDFAQYNQRCHEARDFARLLVEKEEQCPLLVAEDNVRVASSDLIAAMEGTTGITADRLLCSGMEAYNEYVELTLKLLSPYVDKGRALAAAGTPSAMLRSARVERRSESKCPGF